MKSIARICFVMLLVLRGGTCPGAAADSWTDLSPHKTGFVTVDGVQLHYLDWGGSGDVLLFLNGWSDTAHCFDDLAPRFTDRFHCLAFTRRGYGQSGKPSTGYDPLTCMEEVRGFMEAMRIPRATLVGHSFGGFLITQFAAKYPDRVDRLVYLDGIFDYSSPRYEAARKVFAALPYPEPTKADFATVAAYRRFNQLTFFGGEPVRPFWSEAMEAAIRDSVRVRPDGTLELLTPAADDARFSAEAFPHGERFPIDYRRVSAPALAICSDGTAWESISPSLWPKNKSAVNTGALSAWHEASWNEYRENMRHGKIVMLAHTHHYAYVQRLDDVTELMRQFLLEPTRK